MEDGVSASAESSRARPSPGEIQLSGELLNAFMALMPDAAVAVDGEGTIVAVNDQAEALFDYPAGLMIGLPVETLVPERTRHRHRRHRASFDDAPRARPMGAGLELTARRRTGDEFPVDVSLAPVSSAGGPLVVAAVRDVTVQRQATAAQLELATIVQSSVDAIIAIAPDGRITIWNPAASRLFGHAAEDVVDHQIAELIPAHATLVFDDVLGLAAASGPHAAVDTVWRARDGSEIDVALSISPLRDAAGKLNGFSLLLRDVRERKHAERELRRLLAEEERLERQHAVTAEIRLALLSGAMLDESLSLICQHATALLDASAAVLCLRDGAELTIRAGSGAVAGLVGTSLEGSESFAERVLGTGHSMQVASRSAGSGVPVPDGHPDGPTLGIPVVAGGVAEAALIVVRDEGALTYSNVDLVAAESLAAQAALALELQRAHVDREQIMLVSDRERIARDLHDHVIQQLFATGMWLQGALPFIEREPAPQRVTEAIEALDETIREIRNTIYGLLWPAGARQPLKALVIQVAKTAEEALGMRPRLVFEGPVDTAVPDEIVPHVPAVVREGLSNTARHAMASSVSVTLTVAARVLRVTVADNGVGMASPTRSSGLSNLEERARQVGGTFSITGNSGDGTRLEWTAPLPVE